MIFTAMLIADGVWSMLNSWSDVFWVFSLGCWQFMVIGIAEYHQQLEASE